MTKMLYLLTVTGGKAERNVPIFTSSFMTDDVSFPKYGI
jgi:hypothetical protein